MKKIIKANQRKLAKTFYVTPEVASLVWSIIEFIEELRNSE